MRGADVSIVTESDFNGWRFNRDAVHFNGGREFFGWGHRCIDQPRLLVIDKYFKKDRSSQRSYLIDGKTPCATLSDALAALSIPPSLTDAERAKLRAIAAFDWIRPLERAPLLPLADMGLIEWGRDAENNVTCRLTSAGREQLAGTQRSGEGS
jgi:hypothetical protein